jgi:hypothetical protein
MISEGEHSNEVNVIIPYPQKDKTKIEEKAKVRQDDMEVEHSLLIGYTNYNTSLSLFLFHLETWATITYQHQKMERLMD